MNIVVLFLLEWIGAFIAIFILNWIVRWFLSRICNPMTTAIFAFILVGFFVFLTAPYVISSVNPAIVFLPFLILFLIIDLIRANREMK